MTAIFTLEQVRAVADALDPKTAAIVSVFAGRIADTGVDPIPHMLACKQILGSRPKAELLWASTRELLNIFQAEESGCDIITVPNEFLNKLDLVGKDLARIFARDGADVLSRRDGCRLSDQDDPLRCGMKERANMERLFDKVLVTGGAGYCGARLVPQMLARGYKVTVYDIMFFGNQFLPRDNPNLRIVDGDIRDTAKFAAAVAGHDAVVNLACISNDASFELDEDLSTSINLNAFEPLVVAAKKAGVKRFVYASSSSVYGVSDNPDVTEDHPLVPLTLYNKYKGMCEPLLKKHTDASFTGVIFRPATVCGYSPRQRLDLSVNILTNHAINAGKITVFGGSQLRPNLHIQDYCDAVQLFLTAPADKVQNETFNVGYQNLSLMEIAELVRRVVGEEMPDRKAVDIVTTPTDDVRSYHINSDKIKRVLGYQPQHTIEDAVRELCQAFLARKLPNSMEDDRYYNVRLLKRLKAA